MLFDAGDGDRRMIPALVLTAGLATRLRPLSLVRAKAALPVAGQPLVGPHPRAGCGTAACRRGAQPASHAGDTHAHRRRRPGLRRARALLVGDARARVGGRAAARRADPRASAIPDRQRRHADDPGPRARARAPRPHEGASSRMAGRAEHRAAQVQRPAGRPRRRVGGRGTTRVASSRRTTTSACRWPTPRHSTPCRPTRPTSRWRRSIRS